MSVLAKLMSADLAVTQTNLKTSALEGLANIKESLNRDDYAMAAQTLDTIHQMLLDVIPVQQFRNILRQQGDKENAVEQAIGTMIQRTVQLGQLCGTPAPSMVHGAARYAVMTAYANFSLMIRGLAQHAASLMAMGKTPAEALQASKEKLEAETFTPEQIQILASGEAITLPSGQVVRMKPKVAQGAVMAPTEIADEPEKAPPAPSVTSRPAKSMKRSPRPGTEPPRQALPEA